MNFLNRYSAPTTPVIDSRYQTPRDWLYVTALMAILGLLWWFDFPRSVLSPFISSHFPWPGPGSRVLSWVALFFDRLLVESSVCLPVGALLAFALPSRAVLLSSLLVAEEVVRTAPEVLLAPSPKQRSYLLLALGLHALLLIGGTALVRARRRRQIIATSPENP